MNLNIVFTNIALIDPAHSINNRANLWIKDGIIIHCDSSEPQFEKDTEIVESTSYVCSPGLFDMHVHFREPGYEYKEDIQSGTMSAANGGFTGVLCMPNTNPVIDNPVVVEYIKQKSKDLLVDVYPSAALTINQEGNQITSMMELHNAGVLMFTDDGNCVIRSDVMRIIFDYAATKDLLISQHCEDTHLTTGFAMNEGALSDRLGLKGFPYIAEEIIAARDIMLSEYCGRRKYHVSHISTNGSVRIIREAKSRGLRVTCEVTPHHYTLTDSVLGNYDTNFKINPPLRRKRDIEAILEGLVDGTIDCIATDHAPHSLYEKDVEFESAPNGIIGLETALAISLDRLVHTGVISFAELIKKMSINPRQILGLPAIKIEKGEKANITIFDPNEEWTIDKNNFLSKSLNTPFNGYVFKGKPKYAINNNKIHKSTL